ncbi:uncharacterized protein MYCFIDRAFT_173526 [Pseudocercospora fijiensis CIRAD86]|uniref:Uncharacterized protein n=1 Tax=Pseudocercospora fijiensis (strain CIRAD86) TaxID=383855 RepID=M3AIZ2_PSEFD|nr:uncharacterized protein MYCFIDRAFT_173526 [Pseudocercospora fijiensis CIRAD86]EME84566.1 hypothetical protein MYCFIDRAFT_173526 [Pseudocercospora fijiensis CIRAD86]
MNKRKNDGPVEVQRPKMVNKSRRGGCSAYCTMTSSRELARWSDHGSPACCSAVGDEASSSGDCIWEKARILSRTLVFRWSRGPREPRGTVIFIAVSEVGPSETAYRERVRTHIVGGCEDIPQHIKNPCQHSAICSVPTALLAVQVHHTTMGMLLAKGTTDLPKHARREDMAEERHTVATAQDLRDGIVIIADAARHRTCSRSAFSVHMVAPAACTPHAVWPCSQTNARTRQLPSTEDQRNNGFGHLNECKCIPKRACQDEVSILSFVAFVCDDQPRNKSCIAVEPAHLLLRKRQALLSFTNLNREEPLQSVRWVILLAKHLHKALAAVYSSIVGVCIRGFFSHFTPLIARGGVCDRASDTPSHNARDPRQLIFALFSKITLINSTRPLSALTVSNGATIACAPKIHAEDKH